MNKKTISALLLEDLGYKEYKNNPSVGDRFFQKKFTDKKGVKYFINVKHFYYSNNGKQSRFWDFSMQLELEKGSVNFETIQWFNQNGEYSGRNVEDVEEYFEWLWQKHDKPYCKLFGG